MTNTFYNYIGTALLTLLSATAWAGHLTASEDGLDHGDTMQTDAPASTETPPATLPSPPDKSRAIDMLSLGLRLDTSFSEGGPTDQGFAIPSIRLTAFGDLSNSLSYRLSFGQTREYSSAQLPQILPTEAYFNLNLSQNPDTGAPPRLQWRAGMFTPSFNPWWSPDLSDLEIPDYLDSHRALFLSRDIGTEVSYEFDQGLKVGVGAFNGNGIVGLNSNNSKAFTGFARQRFTLVSDASLELGASAYGLFQSEQGSINYKQDWAGDLYLDLAMPSAGLNMMVDGFTGNFQDSTATLSPAGGSMSVTVSILDWLRVFGRYEILSSDPLNDAGNSLHHLQIGPILKIEDGLKIYSFYEYYDHGDGNVENSFQIRARLVI